jgi:NAD-dependent deacetylase
MPIVAEDNLLNEIAAIVGRARRPVAMTGAGISAESGIPTFRGKDGFWKDEDVTRLATLEGFLADPHKVWEWYDWRRSQIRQTRPNPGHFAIAEHERLVAGRGGSFTTITQNIDGLHAMAGSHSVVELHGNIWYSRCLKACTTELTHLPSTPLPEYPPPCPRCGDILRPHVVWFGESLDPLVIEESLRLAGEADVMLVVGTSSQVYPAAGLPYVTKRAGGMVIEINLEPTELTYSADFSLHGRSGEILPDLLSRAREFAE